jgi:hypothetical protein
VAGIHRLEHVQRFAAAHFADDDAIGSHAQCVAHEVTGGDLSAAFDVGRPALQSDNMGLAQSQFGGVFNRDDPLVVGNHRRHRVQQRRLAATGTAAHQDVHPSPHTRGEELAQLVGERAESHEVGDIEAALVELSDRECRTVDGERLNDGVDARTVQESGVDHGRRLVHAPSDLGDDAVDDAPQMLLGYEPGIGAIDLAVTFNVDVFAGVDHHLGDGGVRQVLFDRTVTEDVIGNGVDKSLAFVGGERNPFGLEDSCEFLNDERAQLRFGEGGIEQSHAEAPEQPFLGTALQRRERVGGDAGGIGRRFDAAGQARGRRGCVAVRLLESIAQGHFLACFLRRWRPLAPLETGSGVVISPATRVTS